MRCTLGVAAVLSACMLVAMTVHAQTLSGPVRVLVGGAAGGPSDATMRLLVPHLGSALGQPIVVDNRPGTVGQAAVEQLKNAAPDGRTLMLGNSGTHAIIPALYRNARYDPVADFAPVSLINSTGLVLVSHPSFPVTSFAEFVARARKEPGKLNIGVAGPTGEVAIEALMAPARIRLSNIRYKGSTPAEIAAVSGEVELALLAPVASASHLKSGKLKALGVTTTERLPLLPAVPTIAESGIKGYSFYFWNALFAPVNTSGQLIEMLHREVARAASRADVKERYSALGFITIASTPGDLAAEVNREFARFRKLATETGIGGRE